MSKAVLITGATRGLGEGLTKEFATRGYKLALTGRKADELARLADELRDKTPHIITRVLDVAQYETVPQVLQDCAAELGGLDIIVANAGVGFVTKIGTGKFDEIKTTIDVNLSGAIATSEAAIEIFRKQGHGQLVGISSVASVRGTPGQGAYCASKAGYSKYLESLRCETTDEAIAVTELAPGYIDTDLNRGLESRPFVISTDKGTRIMVDLIERQVGFRYVPPWPWTLVAQVMKLLPISMVKNM